MTVIWAWAERNFATARLGDGRRTRRLVESAARIAAHPEKSFPQVFDWNGLRGFYRLCGRRGTTLAAVMQPHWNQTGADRFAASLSCSCCFGELGRGLAPDLNDHAALKFLVASLLAPPHERLPLAVDLDAPQQ